MYWVSVFFWASCLSFLDIPSSPCTTCNLTVLPCWQIQVCKKLRKPYSWWCRAMCSIHTYVEFNYVCPPQGSGGTNRIWKCSFNAVYPTSFRATRYVQEYSDCLGTYSTMQGKVFAAANYKMTLVKEAEQWWLHSFFTGSLGFNSCRVLQVSDFYPIFYNPTLDYVHQIKCTYEVVYPLWVRGALWDIWSQPV